MVGIFGRRYAGLFRLIELFQVRQLTVVRIYVGMLMFRSSETNGIIVRVRKFTVEIFGR